jgi:predicted RNase H-like nuclease (RuvC/YqgF family)
MPRRFETMSAREYAEYQAKRITELETELQASQTALRELQARLEETATIDARRDLAPVAKALG